MILMRCVLSNFVYHFFRFMYIKMIHIAYKDVIRCIYDVESHEKKRIFLIKIIIVGRQMRPMRNPSIFTRI